MIETGTLRNLFAFVAQTTAIAGAAILLLKLLRVHSPSIRYAALRFVLAACLLLPLVQPRLALPVVAIDAAGLAPGFPAAAAAPAARPGAPVQPRAPIAWPALLGALILGGALIRAGWTGLGLVRLRALRRSGEAAPFSREHAELQSLIGTAASIRYVPGLGQPVTFGCRRPVVLLPERLEAMPGQVQRAVVAHELWHVRRRDWAWTVAEEIVRAALWFNPAIWALLSQVQSAREEVVDELTVLVTGSRRTYLDALLAFADEPPVFAAAAFARRRHLVRRMLLISKERVMSSRRVVASGAVFLAALLAAGWQAVQAFPLTAQMPRDPVRQAPPPPAAPQKAPVDEASLLKKIQADPSPANYMALATFYWEKAFKDRTLTPAEKATVTMLGIQATDSALAGDPEYFEAMIYKNILLRMQANDSTDPEEQKRLLAEADALRNRAIEIRKQQGVPAATGRVGPGVPPPPPPPPPPPVDGVAPLRVGGNIAPPQKVRHVNPVYPEEAQAARVQGVVIVEATIDTAGRVGEVRILRSIPLLDEAAVEAVRQWEFTPTLLNGAPVPVIMTMTVNFTLQ